MIVKVRESEIDGSLSVPPSKSLTHRALLCSAMAGGRSRVKMPLISDDTKATRNVLRGLGIDISANKNQWRVTGGEPRNPGQPLFCNESGTTLRFITAFCALVDAECKLTGGPSLSNRPIEPLLAGLRQLGVQCKSNDGKLPVKVRGGNLEGGKAEIPGDISSQFVSALLLIGPKAEEGIKLGLTTNLESKPYVNLTMDVQEKYGVKVLTSRDMKHYEVERQDYRPTDYRVEGDWSSAVFPMASGALTGNITVTNLDADSKQPDSAFINVLNKMGVKPQLNSDGISVKKGSLESFKVDLSDTPDLFPILTALASVADGVSELRGLDRLRYKESNRILAMMEGLQRMGIEVNKFHEGITVKGGKPEGGTIDPKKDHRIAMAFTILGLVSKGETVILDAECVSKSYPRFWPDMKSIGADVQLIKDE